MWQSTRASSMEYAVAHSGEIHLWHARSVVVTLMAGVPRLVALSPSQPPEVVYPSLRMGFKRRTAGRACLEGRRERAARRECGTPAVNKTLLAQRGPTAGWSGLTPDLSHRKIASLWTMRSG